MKTQSMSRLLAPLALLISIILPGPETARAQEEGASKTCPCPTDPKHVLGGHAYLPTFSFPSPFADSQATLAMNFGYGTYTTRILRNERELQIGAFQPLAQGQVNIFDGLAINFGIKGKLVSGLNTAAALDYGASVSYALQLGLLLEVLRSETNILSIGLDVSRPHSLSLSPLDAIGSGLQSLVGNGDPDYTSDSVTTRWMPSLRFAHTFGSFIGLQAYGAPRFDNTTEENGDSTLKSSLNLGLGVSTDFKPWIGIPIGLTANYRRGQMISSGGSNSNTLAFGLFETFTNSFNIGIEAGFVNGESSDTTIVSLLAKAYFN